MSDRLKVSLYVDHVDDSSDFDKVNDWLARWGDKVTVKSYSTGGWEHCWDLLAPAEAVAELPAEWLCDSEWATPELFEAKLQ
ncbi:hypothetical protein [Thiobacillus sp.]|uniref:hypothetical protein n=1 Tax=Thiobacillus sp. TaxID=924 RepID=UPI0018503B13|nr:hypothetical protein [Thiobacillus sp.]MBC2729754.1 hypothetical protein [Thiobacillus sp.]MBC2738489.1 hypothetical protein [Thiobacillus sp.]MBC2761231.1 hypothetical protein [Thiobacillus sp.]